MGDSDNPIIRRALISTSDKSNLIDFARALQQNNIEILSTGGTARLLKQHDINVIDVADYTGFPEMMDGRVKTLHPKVHGALLGRQGIDDAVMAEHEIIPIDLVVVNLYPFQTVTQQADCDLATAIENIDIGGPTMVRAAAKNQDRVTIVVDPQDYTRVLTELTDNNGAVPLATRRQLAQKAFAHTAQYDAAISQYLANETYPETFNLSFSKQSDLRYGENPHQSAAFYTESPTPAGTIASAALKQGKALSFNNIADADAAWESVKALGNDQPACVIVKHANPCGVALHTTQVDAYQRAYATDSTSSFGGIIAFNRPLQAKTAQAILDQQFVEVIIAPDIDADALTVLAKKPNIRVLATGHEQTSITDTLDFKRVQGGMLIQQLDIGATDEANWKVVTERHPTDNEWQDCRFAWQVVRFVKSNAIIFCQQQATVGIGAGQMSRVDSVRIAQSKAQHAELSLDGTVLASDAFFPFRDSIDLIAELGVKTIIQPGGSIRDEEVIAAANEAGIAMIFTGERHFRH